MCTSIIFISSVQHSAANFCQYDEYAFPPYYPAFISGKPPTNKVNKNELIILLFMKDNLSNKTYSGNLLLFDFL